MNATIVDVPEYERDGFVIFSNVLSPPECDQFKQEACRLIRERECSTGKVYPVYLGAAAASERFYQLTDDPRIVAILRAIMPTGIMFLSDKLVFKSEQAKFATPWHIDAAYWPNTRSKLSVWLPLDDATASNGTLTVVRGSHRHEWKHNRSDTHETLGAFQNIIRDRPWNPRDEVICNISRGSAIFFSDKLVHSSCPNTTGADRFTIISTYHAPAADEVFDKDYPARHVIL